jgi:gas vesicle protein
MFNIKSKFGWGVMVGAVLGSVATYFFSPRTGKENREIAHAKLKQLNKLMKEKNIEEMAKEIFGKATAEGQRLYTQARAEMNKKLEELKEQAGDIDYGKYKKVVLEVLSRLKEEKDATKDRLSKLQEYLLNRWDTVEYMLDEDIEETAKKVVDSEKKR